MPATIVHTRQPMLRGGEAFAARVISPEAPPWRRFASPWVLLTDFWRHRHLIGQLVKRELRCRYLGSRLGLAWSLLTPLATLAVYTFVFQFVLKVRWEAGGVSPESPVSFAMTLFCGLLTFQLFGEAVQKAPGLVLRNPGFVKRVVFPLQILPLTSVLATLTHILFGLALVALLAGELAWTVLWLPAVLLPYLCFILGASWLLASAGVFLRDLTPAMAIGCQLLLFATPVFYPLSAVPELWRPVLLCNPLAAFVENVRRVLLWNQPPEWPRLLALGLLSIIVMQAGYIFFMKNQRAFADVV